MYKINKKDLDIFDLEKIKNQGTRSIIYKDNKYCYKIFNSHDYKIYNGLDKKIDKISLLNIDNLILPECFIYDKSNIIGYITPYINSCSLADKFDKNINFKELIFYLKKLSKTIKLLHKNGIIYQDLNFKNILIDKKKKIHICDIESCSYENFNGPFITSCMYNYLYNYNNATIDFDENFDKLSLILELCLLITDKNVNEITNKEIEFYSSNINTLNNLKDVVINLKDKKIKNVHYLDYYIDNNDDCEIIKNKKLIIKH